MLAAATSSAIAERILKAASTLPANTSRSERDRVNTVFQVPCRSSEANRSPASTPAITGKPQLAAKLSTTSDSAPPDWCTQVPNSASAGVPFCRRRTSANANGPASPASTSTRSGAWARSLRRSTRATESTRSLLT